MNKKIKKYITIIAFCVLTFTTINVTKTQAYRLEGAEGTNASADNTSNKGSGSSSSGAYTPPPNHSSGVGSWDYPYMTYTYTQATSQLIADLNAFASQTKNGTKTYKVYNDPNEYPCSYRDNYGNTITQYYKTIPSVVYFKKTTTPKSETGIVTDYYQWSSNGAESWVKNGDRYLDFTPTQVGTVTITSVPHEIKTVKNWETYEISSWEKFSTNYTNTITDSTSQSPVTSTVSQYLNDSKKRTWTFTITPPEVGKNIHVDYDKTGPYNPNGAEAWADTQLIQ